MTIPHRPENGGRPVDRVQRESGRDGFEPSGGERAPAGTGSEGGDGPERNGAGAVGGESAGAGLHVHRRRLLDWVRGQLVGPAGSGWLRGSPVERYPAGVLHPVDPAGSGTTGLDPAQSEKDDDAPRHDPAGQPVDSREAHGSESAAAPPDDEEDDDAPVGAEGPPDRVAARPVGRRRYVPPSSVGVSFYVRGDARLRVTASAASYRRVHERGASGRFVAHRPDADHAGGGGGETDDGGGSRARYERMPFQCGLIWPDGEAGAPVGARGHVRRRPYRDGDLVTATFSDPSPATPPGPAGAASPAWETQLDVRRRSYGDGHILTVVFANRRPEAPPGTDRAERRLFEARLECVVEAGELAEYPRVDPALLTDEEQEIELRYRDTHIYAIGHGAAADWVLEPGRPPRIRSACMPAVDVPLVTTQVDGVDDRVLVMEDIAAKGAFRERLSRFEAFVAAYGAWVGRQHAAARRFTAGERAAADRICARMDEAQERMRGGVERLRRDDDAALAFRLANQAMLDQMRQHDVAAGRDRDVRDYRWRPFQLAFLLAVIESTLDEHDARRDVLDLIWFPTGGGKTEAYLGLIAFLIVWRRLRYGEAGGGTTVLMRYTLRLLTRQQFERAARIVCALERLRRLGAAPLGDEPITAGLWVGAAASPNTLEEAAKQVAAAPAPRHAGPAAESAGAGPEAAEPPAGDGARAAAPDVAAGAGPLLALQACPWCGRPFAAPYGYRAGPQESGFLCGNPECAFGDGRPLPCRVVDEALYERPPTLLVGTIDKFARLAWEERAAAFFGRGRRRPPELVIQDELHLIAGPLGSVAGVYEAAVDTVLERRGVRPKYIASTATIRTARDQVRSLYGRDMAVFPPPRSVRRRLVVRPHRPFAAGAAVRRLPGAGARPAALPGAARRRPAGGAGSGVRGPGGTRTTCSTRGGRWWSTTAAFAASGPATNAFVTDVRTFLRASRRGAGPGGPRGRGAVDLRLLRGGRRRAPPAGGGPAHQPVVRGGERPHLRPAGRPARRAGLPGSGAGDQHALGRRGRRPTGRDGRQRPAPHHGRVHPGQQPHRARRGAGPRLRQLLPPTGAQPVALRELPPLPRVVLPLRRADQRDAVHLPGAQARAATRRWSSPCATASTT